MIYFDARPLFDGKTMEGYNEAVKYMAEGMAKSTIDKIATPTPSDVMHKMYNEIVVNMIDNVPKVYGMNAITVANMQLVENEFINIYYPSIMRYLDLVGINAFAVLFRPSDVMPFIIMAESRKPGFQPLENWDPNERWTVEDIDFGDDKRRNLLNPFAGALRFDLRMKFLGNLNLVKELQRVFNISGPDMAKEVEAGKPANISIRMLPAVNYKGINAFVQTIHKYT